jgi:hypothetical protein
MSSLSHRQQKIQEKRKQTPWREFVMEIISYYSLNLYKKDNTISSFSPHTYYNIINWLEFEQTRQEYCKLGKEYSWNFLNDFIHLSKIISYPNIASWWNNENSLFAHKIMYGNNCYLSFEVCDSENVLYSINVKDHCKNIYNSMMIGDYSENIYHGTWIYQSNMVFYSKFIFNSNNIYFSTNLVWCAECIFCDWLNNQSYHIENRSYTKREYLIKKEEILKNQKIFNDTYMNLDIGLGSLISTQSTWKFLIKTDKVENWYFAYNINSWRNVMFAGTAHGNQNFYDAASCGAPRWDYYYGVIWAWIWDHYYCSVEVLWWTNNYYCYFLDDCSFCLGCIGLKNKSYCILNKQYTKEERYKKVDEIFAQMDADGTLGEFFPATMNPFYFNDTAAYLIDNSFTREEVTAKWYLWRDEPIKVDIPAGMDIVKTSELDQYEWFDTTWNRTINTDILKKVIQDEQWNVYRIVKMEYDFLIKHGLPLPRKHWLERMKENFRIG